MPPRFLHTNHITASGTVLSATSFQPGFPVSHLKDQAIGKELRTQVGWTVVAGFNDKLDFTEAGVARVATLTAGYYATGAQMATAAQNAMNAAPGATNTYTITYDAGDKIFTIERATGSDALVLKFGTGANVTSGAHPDLGFSNLDKDSATSYDADNAVFQSRHAILADLGVAQIVTAGAAVLSTAAQNAALTLQGSDSSFVGVGALATPAFSQGLLGGTTVRYASFASETRRYWRLILDDRFNLTPGYSAVAVWFVGGYGETAKKHAVGMSRHYEELSTLEFAKAGAQFQDLQPRRLVINFDWRRLLDSDRLIVETVAAACPLGKNLFLVIDPETAVLYGFFRRALSETHRPRMAWDVPVEFAQALP